jgi:hypothetical protein
MSYPYHVRQITDAEYIALSRRDCTDTIKEMANAQYEKRLINYLIDIFNRGYHLRNADMDDRSEFVAEVNKISQMLIDDWAEDRKGWGYE